MNIIRGLSSATRAVTRDVRAARVPRRVAFLCLSMVFVSLCTIFPVSRFCFSLPISFLTRVLESPRTSSIFAVFTPTLPHPQFSHRFTLFSSYVPYEKTYILVPRFPIQQLRMYSPAHVLLRLRRLELGPLPVARESGGDASRMAPSAWFAARPNAILLALPESRVIRQPVAATASDTAHHCSSAMLSPAILGW